MRAIPEQPETPNIRRLSQFLQEEQTGKVGASLTTEEVVVEGEEAIFKNGFRLRRGVDYTLAGRTVTLTVASVAGDVWQLDYYYS